MRALTHTAFQFADPSYMSPEQCLGDRLDERSDVYALGCILYEALTGKPPFQKKTAIETAMRQISVAPKRMDMIMVNCDLPRELEAVVLRAMAKNPASRYQSMEELAIALEEQLGGKAAMAAFAQKRAANIPTKPQLPAGKTETVRWSNRTLTILIATGVLLCSLILSIPLFITHFVMTHIQSPQVKIELKTLSLNSEEEPTQSAPVPPARQETPPVVKPDSIVLGLLEQIATGTAEESTVAFNNCLRGEGALPTIAGLLTAENQDTALGEACVRALRGFGPAAYQAIFNAEHMPKFSAKLALLALGGENFEQLDSLFHHNPDFEINLLTCICMYANQSTIDSPNLPTATVNEMLHVLSIPSVKRDFGLRLIIITGLGKATPSDAVIEQLRSCVRDPVDVARKAAGESLVRVLQSRRQLRESD